MLPVVAADADASPALARFRVQRVVNVPALEPEHFLQEDDGVWETARVMKKFGAEFGFTNGPKLFAGEGGGGCVADVMGYHAQGEGWVGVWMSPL